MKKQILKFSGITLLVVIALSSCSKKVTSRKLDGDWTVTSGVGTYVETVNGIALTDNITIDGSKFTIVDHMGETEVSEQTMTYSFDKKEGTFTRTETEIDYDTNSVPYYTFDGDEYNFDGHYSSTSIENETVEYTGNYTITGGTGEIKKNSKIVLYLAGINRSTTTSYKYFDGLTQVTNLTGFFFEKYNYNTNNYEYIPISSSSSSSSTATASSYYAQLINIESITKNEMVMNFEDTYNSGTSGFSIKMQYTLTQK